MFSNAGYVLGDKIIKLKVHFSEFSIAFYSLN